jgi:hypothetical protein
MMNTSPLHLTTQLTLLLATVLLSGCGNEYDPNHPDQSDIKGVWELNNSISRGADERPVIDILEVSGTHMEFTEGHGTEGVQGQWKSDGFWVTPADGNGQPPFQAVKILDAEHVFLYLSAFEPGRSDTVTLYKVRGDDAEVKALASVDPGPVVHPPPQGAIWPGISEYHLRSLPWKADKIEAALDLSYEEHHGSFVVDQKDVHSTDGEIVYIYKSFDPKVDDLHVTVKNHIVMTVTGGR